MTAQKKKAEDDYYCVSLPPSEWRHIDRWLGDNVSLTSVILTELNKIQKTYEKGKRSAVRIGIASIDTMIGGPTPRGIALCWECGRAVQFCRRTQHHTCSRHGRKQEGACV